MNTDLLPTTKSSNEQNNGSDVPIVWTIGGSDSGGGAGIQADIKTMSAIGVHGCSVVTAITAQNSFMVNAVEPVSTEMLESQIQALLMDLRPDAIKVSMLPTTASVDIVVETLKQMEAFVIYDPVLKASSGGTLSDLAVVRQRMNTLLPIVRLITPNLSEAESLAQRTIHNADDMEKAAADLIDMGVYSVLLKGGHLEGDYCQDLWTDGHQSWWFTSPRQDFDHTHGTGCTFSTAIAGYLALGYPVLDAVVLAKAYINQGIREGVKPGHGPGTLTHSGWFTHSYDLPWVTPTAEEGREDWSFPDCEDESIELYPIIERASWLEDLLPAGIKWVQLRAKNLSGEALANEVHKAVKLGNRYGARVIINDAWEEAIEAGAFGIHLGQDDLASADMHRIAVSGCHLGISTHSYFEIARAWAYRPSYVALGTVFETNTKVMDYEPLGLDRFATMRKVIPVPTVAIGGIHLGHAAALQKAGADGMAVISEIRNSPDLQGTLDAWLSFFSNLD